MPLDPRVKRFLDVLAAGNPPATLDRQRRRAARAARRADEARAAPRRRSPRRGPSRCPAPRDRSRARLYTPAEASRRCCPGSCTFTAAAWSQAPSTRTTPSRARSPLRGVPRRLASTTAWRPNTRFRQRSTMPAPRSRHRASTRADFGIDADAARHLRRLGGRHARGGGLPGRFARAGKPPPRAAGADLPDPRLQPQSGSRRDFASGYLVDQATLEHDLMHYAPGGADPDGPAHLAARAPPTSAVCRTPSFIRRSSIRCATRGGIISSA